MDAKMLRELLAGANPLPWSVWCSDDGKPLDFGGLTVVRDAAGSVVAKFNREMAANLVFIRDANDRLACGAVNSLPVLLDELASLQSRLAAAEAECRAREEVQARLIRERNAAEAEAERAAGLLRRARRLLHEPSMFGREKLDACVERIDAHLASRPEGEVRRG